jgi:hypothetical protein
MIFTRRPPQRTPCGRRRVSGAMAPNQPLAVVALPEGEDGLAQGPCGGEVLYPQEVAVRGADEGLGAALSSLAAGRLGCWLMWAHSSLARKSFSHRRMTRRITGAYLSPGKYHETENPSVVEAGGHRRLWCRCSPGTETQSKLPKSCRRAEGCRRSRHRAPRLWHAGEVICACSAALIMADTRCVEPRQSTRLGPSIFGVITRNWRPRGDSNSRPTV